MPLENTEASFKLTDRTALITGPCNSINQAIAMRLTQVGANVAIVDRNTEQAARFANQLMDAREINERYGRAVAIQSDLTSPSQIQDAISRVAESFGGIDIYIDSHMTLDVQPFQNATALENLDKLVDTNLKAPIRITHSILRFLGSRKRGRVIYLMHDICRLGMPQNGLMSLTRTGLSAFARTLSREVAESNITVNCVAMGITEEFLLAQIGDEKLSIQEAQKRLTQQFPQAVMTEPEKIANLILFLASPLGSSITGQTIAASSGLSFMS